MPPQSAADRVLAEFNRPAAVSNVWAGGRRLRDVVSSARGAALRGVDDDVAWAERRADALGAADSAKPAVARRA